MPRLSRIVVPLWQGFTGHAGRMTLLDQAERLQWQSPALIARHAWQKAARLLNHLEQHVPYYRRRFADLGLRAAEIRGFDDFDRLPILTKQDSREHESALRADGLAEDQTVAVLSSGSTGTPSIVHHLRDGAYTWVGNLRANRWAGMDWWVKVGSLWTVRNGIPVEPTWIGWWPKDPSSIRALLGGTTREIHLAPFHLDHDVLSGFSSRLSTFQPAVLFGTPNALRILAMHVQSHGPNGIRPSTVVTCGELLTPDTRQELRAVFGGRVHSRYGTNEVGTVAAECEHGAMHLNADNLYVEVDRASNDPLGRILVTDLNNYATGVLRYDLGDTATGITHGCPCGRGLPILQGFEGRITETLRTAAGVQVSGMWMQRLMRTVPGLRQYQVHQRAPAVFDLHLVWYPSAGDHTEALAGAIGEIRAKFGSATQVNLLEAEEIPLVGRGKHRFIISDLA